MSNPSDKDVLDLVEYFNSSDVTLLHVRSPRFELRLSRDLDGRGLRSLDDEVRIETSPASSGKSDEQPVVVDETAGSDVPGSDNGTVAPAEADEVFIESDSVGVFYRAARPDLPPYVEVGAKVEESTTVGLIEAMKVFTAVSARTSGTITEILVENEGFVEYGQPLFRVSLDT